MSQLSVDSSSRLPPAHARAAGTPRLLAPDDAARRLDRLLAAAAGHRHALVLTHDNPDPDSVSAAMGVAFLLEERAGVEARIAYGGIVGRAENRALLRVLKVPAVHVSRLDVGDFDFVALVDTQPVCGNHSLAHERPPDAVVDHHPARDGFDGVCFADVGGDYGATATIVAEYIRAAGLRPPPALATALFYGIKSDTRDLGREFSRADVTSYQWLFPFVDNPALSQIEHPHVPAEYFEALHRALGRARRHGEAVVADLGNVYVPDIVAEVAERLISLEDVRWSLAMGNFEGQVYCSVRTGDRRMNAGRMVRQIFAMQGGSAGGHGSMAGGRALLPHGPRRDREAFRRRLLRAFLAAFDAPARGRRLF